MGIKITASEEQRFRLLSCPKDDTMIVSLSQSSRLWESTVLVRPTLRRFLFCFYNTLTKKAEIRLPYKGIIKAQIQQ